MARATLATLIVARTIFVIQIVLGLLFWTLHALQLIPLHQTVGLLLVLDMWVAIVLGVRAGVPIGIALVAFVWSLLMPVLGFGQFGLLPGPAHIAVQIVHLLVGIVAVALVEGLARPFRRQSAAATS